MMLNLCFFFHVRYEKNVKINVNFRLVFFLSVFLHFRSLPLLKRVCVIVIVLALIRVSSNFNLS